MLRNRSKVMRPDVRGRWRYMVSHATGTGKLRSGASTADIFFWVVRTKNKKARKRREEK
jgi:ribosomal protein L2